ncbi:MAG: ATP-binding cassette domain-containing protein, partial [Proteobacteria bacterium]|nr:ATP-binding cassette domain-containing protein [Pseudomonadota bacterium]
MLVLQKLCKTYAGARSRSVLRDVDLALAPGEYIAVMGESGIGKSTLLNLIAGLDTPDAGSIHFEGADLAGMDDDALTL